MKLLDISIHMLILVGRFCCVPFALGSRFVISNPLPQAAELLRRLHLLPQSNQLKDGHNFPPRILSNPSEYFCTLVMDESMLAEGGYIENSRKVFEGECNHAPFFFADCVGGCLGHEEED